MRILLLYDVRAVDVGLDYRLGLLGKKGEVIDALIPVADKLIHSGKARVARPDEATSQPSTFKRGHGGKENKMARPAIDNKSRK